MAETDTLEHAFAANGDSDVIDWSGRFLGYFEVRGTFGGGTATLKHSTDGGATWRTTDAIDLVFSEDGSYGFRLPPCQLKVVLSGATSPDLTAIIQRSAV